MVSTLGIMLANCHPGDILIPPHLANPVTIQVVGVHHRFILNVYQESLSFTFSIGIQQILNFFGRLKISFQHLFQLFTGNTFR